MQPFHTILFISYYICWKVVSCSRTQVSCSLETGNIFYWTSWSARILSRSVRYSQSSCVWSNLKNFSLLGVPQNEIDLKSFSMSISNQEDSFADICIMSLRDEMDFLMFNQAWAHHAIQDIWKVFLSLSLQSQYLGMKFVERYLETYS